MINADSTSTQLDDTGAMTGHGQLASVPRNVTAMKSTMSRKEPLAPTGVCVCVCVCVCVFICMVCVCVCM